jgi:PHD/YefM family antitoxin component YafN of YafNO toxin-antitoxin module
VLPLLPRQPGKLVEDRIFRANKRLFTVQDRRVRQSGRNGKAEVVVQDAAAYRRLVERAAHAEREATVAAIRDALEDVEAGRTKPARAAIRRLAKKHGIPCGDE